MFSATFSFEESPTCPVCLSLFPAQHCSILRYFFPQAGTGVNYRPSGTHAWKKRRPAIRANLFIQETEWYGKERSAKPCRGPSFCFGKKNQKPLAAIIIPPILCTYDPARSERLAAGMLRQIKAKKQSRPGGLSWIHSDVPPAKEEVIGPFHDKFKSNKKPAKPGQEPTRLSLRIVDRVQNGLRVSQRDKQQDPCGPFRFATSLLPIAECGRADTQ
jgi:hypothetical protein